MDVTISHPVSVLNSVIGIQIRRIIWHDGIWMSRYMGRDSNSQMDLTQLPESVSQSVIEKKMGLLGRTRSSCCIDFKWWHGTICIAYTTQNMGEERRVDAWMHACRVCSLTATKYIIYIKL